MLDLDYSEQIAGIDRQIESLNQRIADLEKEIVDSGNPDEKIPVAWKTIDKTIERTVNGETTKTVKPTVTTATKFTTRQKQLDNTIKMKKSYEKTRASYVKLLEKQQKRKR